MAYPPTNIRERHSLRHHIDLNDVVDAVLRTIYDTTMQEGAPARRNVVFTSFSPDVCSALNWKQPNCTSLRHFCGIYVEYVPNRCADPVFFASLCGQAGVNPPSTTALTVQDTHDYRLSSLGAAVEWCKLNNLLGLLLDSELLVRGPRSTPAPAPAELEKTIEQDTVTDTRCQGLWSSRWCIWRA